MTAPAVRASASWIRLLGLLHAYEAAALLGDGAEADRVRAQAHDLLDTTLDQRAEKAAEVRAVLERG